MTSQTNHQCPYCELIFEYLNEVNLMAAGAKERSGGK